MATAPQRGKPLPHLVLAESNRKMSTTTRTDSRRADSQESGKAGGKAPQPDDWSAWVAHLAKRRRPKPLHRTISSKVDEKVRDPLRWCLPADLPADSRDLLKELSRVVRGKSVAAERLTAKLESRLNASESHDGSSADHDETSAWEILGWCHAAPRLAEFLPAAPWNQLLDYLQATAQNAFCLPLEEGLLRHQLLAGELPLTLAVLFPELDSCRALFDDARRNLSWGMCESLDGEGLPQASALDEIRPLLACWTRCVYMDSACLDDDAQAEFAWLVRQALRMCRGDGRQVLAGETTAAWDKPLFAALLALAGDRDDWAAAQRLLSLKRTKGRAGIAPEPSVISAWSELAVMRSEWTKRAPQFAVRFDHPRMQCELSCGRSLLLSGQWKTSFEVDGRAVDDDSEWDETCCFSDKDVDYLELERPLSKTWRVQRQILLARRDGFLFLADALLGEGTAELVCRSEVPLGEGIAARFAQESREGELANHKSMARLLPLALPEWRVEPAQGELSGSPSAIRWESRGRGSCLFHPLFIDLDKRRAEKPLTWRRLTIAEDRTIQPPDVAVGYRIQIGSRQWIVYRALSHAANRSVLGQNYSQEFVMARFTKEGTSDPMIEIEME